MSLVTNKNKKRNLIFFTIIAAMFLGLLVRLGWIQIVNSQKYEQLALEQQTRDIPIPAKRGIIFDRNGKKLAATANTHTIWARPSEVKSSKDPSETGRFLAEVLDKNYEEIMALITKENVGLVRVARWVESDAVDKIHAYQKENIKESPLEGIWLAEDNKRVYPYGSFAAHIIGHTTVDNLGLSGIELRYDKYLSGLPGRWIRNTDASGRRLSYGTEKFFQSENGLNTVLTIDEAIQHFIEKAIENAYEKTGAKKVMAIAMNPKNGDILGMATYPDYDPNNAREPLEANDLAFFNTLETNEEKTNYWNQMWRNPIVSDTYEPGSTFKLITTAIALEEKVATVNSTYNCTGTMRVGDSLLKCWRYPMTHGHQTLAEAVQNSCNPVFIQLSQGTGLDTYYEYLKNFGIMEKTNVDLPGESNPIIQNKNNIGPVELATISYGQGISITPIQLLTAICAIGNDGILMEPRIVNELVDDDGNVIHRYEPVTVRQVISKETADEMRMIMESVVTEGSGSSAHIPGYRVGGKTGTADKVIDGRYVDGKVYSSFISMAPMDDPQVALLVVVDEPQGVRFGSQTAAPAAKEILTETLRYLNVETSYSAEELKSLKEKYIEVPNITHMPFSEARTILEKAQLQYEVIPEEASLMDFQVEEQYPKAGELVIKNGTLFLYQK